MFAVEDALPIRIPSAGSAALTFAYAPRAAISSHNRARATIVSNDPAEPRAEFGLSGSGVAAALLIQPMEAAFGTRQINLPATRSVYLYNTGGAQLTIYGQTFRVVDAAGALSPHYSLIDFAGVPIPQNDLRIPAGGWFGITIRYAPAATGDHAARIVVQSSDPALPQAEIAISGMAAA
jgi:hypothetical protein